ncbi:MAG: hypothetical protein AAGK74_16665 [Chloroflexota bacterium]
MAKQQKRNVVDDLADRARELLDELERLLRPEPQQQPARVPVPVQPPRPRRRRR